MTSYQLTHKSYKSASIPTVQNKYILEEFHATVTNPWSLTWNRSGTLLHKTLHFTNTSLHSQIKQNSLAMKSNSQNGSHKWYRSAQVHNRMTTCNFDPENVWHFQVTY